VIAFLGRLLAPVALKLLAWGALALTVLSAIGGAILMIRRDAVSGHKAKQAEQTIERVEDVRKVEDIVARMPAHRVDDELSKWRRD